MPLATDQHCFPFLKISIKTCIDLLLSKPTTLSSVRHSYDVNLNCKSPSADLLATSFQHRTCYRFTNLPLPADVSDIQRLSGAAGYPRLPGPTDYAPRL